MQSKAIRRNKNWSKANDEELKERHKTEQLSDIARSMGYAYSTVAKHAHKLGLFKPGNGRYNTAAREIVKGAYYDHSYRELAKMANVDMRTVWSIINELGLKRTDEQSWAIRSRIHKDTYVKERRRVNWGLEQKTKLKVYCNKRKSELKRRLENKGYIRDDDGFTLYYTEETKRSMICEEHGIVMGLRFGPLPTVNSEETEYDSASQCMWDVRPEQISIPEYA